MTDEEIERHLAPYLLTVIMSAIREMQNELLTKPLTSYTLYLVEEKDARRASRAVGRLRRKILKSYEDLYPNG